MAWLKWLYPGMKIKRWILVGLFGVLLVSAGIALLAGIEVLSVVEGWVIGRVIRLTGSWPVGIVDAAAFLILVAGFFLIVIGFRQSTRSLVDALAPDAVPYLADIVYAERSRRKGPKVVVIGGGTGLSTLLCGLKEHTSNITAIVAVSDDGGSSGRLRSELGVPPPGDIRNTLLALADAEPLMQRLFDYRFTGKGELAGHSFGNLLIAALTEVTGDFEAAVRESSRVLAIRGTVLPGTLEDVSLRARFTDGTTISGESRIPEQRKKIERIFLEPPDVEPAPEVCKAIAEADMIILGPGSLYTSVLPNLLIPEVAEAVREAKVPKIYVCNVMTQPGETTGYTVEDHVQAIVDHVGPGLFDYVLMNSAPVPPAVTRKYAAEGAEWVEPAPRAVRRLGLIPVAVPLIDNADLARHSPERLAEAVMNIYEREVARRTRRH